jgi:hypothetical protein
LPEAPPVSDTHAWSSSEEDLCTGRAQQASIPFDLDIGKTHVH